MRWTFRRVHEIKDIDLPHLNPYLIEEINCLDVKESLKYRALEYFSDIADDTILCHLDYHFLNLMYAQDRYYMIDWVNAKVGNPIYDYARTYVILYEFANRFSKKFLNLLYVQGEFDPGELKKAIYIMCNQFLGT